MTSSRRSLASAAFVAALLGGSASAGSTLELQKSGGGIGQSVTFELEGGAGRPYLLWADLVEVDTRIAPGVVAKVGFDWIALSLQVPGFVGALKSDGTATVAASIPNDPALEGVRVSFQAVYVDVVDAVSNLIRLTPDFPGSFQDALGAPAVPLVSGVASTQPDGSVLLVDTTLPIVQRYDPNLEEFDFAGLSCALGLLSTFNVLPDGRVFLSGGIDATTGQPQTTCVLFDPVTLSCTQYQMSTPRAGHAAAVTSKGEVLLSGGFTNFDFSDLTALFQGITNTTELFDPVAGTFRSGGSLLESKALHSATATSDGKVLVAGGLTLVPILNVPFVSFTAYVYNPNNDTFGLPLLFTDGRVLHSATLLDDKRILLAGGMNVDFSTFLQTGNLADLKLTALSTGEVWKSNFLGGSFKHVTGMQSGRALPAVTALPGAQALVAGGFDLSITGSDPTQWIFAPQATADRFASDAFNATGSMSSARIAPISVLLDDGTVLVVGGLALGAEVYQP